MRLARRKALLVAAGMGSAVALASMGVPTRKIADTWVTNLETMFPAAFGDWAIDRNQPVILPAPDVQAKLDAIYNQVLARTYVNAATGERVMLSVAYGGDQSDGMQAHLPEVCYPAQGFELRRSNRHTLLLAGRQVPVRQIETRLGGRFEPVTYWLTLGETVAASRSERKLAQMRYGLRGMVPDGMLVRVSSIDRDAAQGFATHERFLRDMVGAIPVDLRSRVVGALNTDGRGA